MMLQGFARSVREDMRPQECAKEKLKKKTRSQCRPAERTEDGLEGNRGGTEDGLEGKDEVETPRVGASGFRDL